MQCGGIVALLATGTVSLDGNGGGGGASSGNNNVGTSGGRGGGIVLTTLPTKAGRRVLAMLCRVSPSGMRLHSAPPWPGAAR